MFICYTTPRDVVYGGCAAAYSNRILLILLLVRFAPCDVHYKCLLATLVVGMLFMGVVRWLALIAYCLLSSYVSCLSPSLPLNRIQYSIL